MKEFLEIEPLDATMPADVSGEPVDDAAAGNDEEGKRTSAGYTSSAERCSSCVSYTQDDMRCSKFSFDAEPDGHCNSWDAVGEDMKPAEGAEPLETLEDDDLDPFD